MIFLHSSFRTSSTWLWTKFRDQDRFLSYYEVFNQALASLTDETIAKMDQTAWDTRHPPTKPYFLEFAPLLQEAGGVRLFTEDMAYRRFIPETGIQGDISDGETIYLTSLIDHAKTQDKVPLLSGTRSLGRVAGIKRALGGTHILIYRNPFHQWCSYSEQFLRQNFAFVESVRDTLLSNPHDPFLAEITKAFDIQAGAIDNNKLLLTFVLLHLYLYAQSAGHFDMIVDVNRLATEPEYRINVQGELATQCGGTFNLSDARLSLGANLTLLGPRKDVEAILEPWVARIIATSPTELGKHLAIKGYVDFLNEYERHFFYVLPLVKIWQPLLFAWETGKQLREDEISYLKGKVAEMENASTAALTS